MRGTTADIREAAAHVHPGGRPERGRKAFCCLLCLFAVMSLPAFVLAEEAGHSFSIPAQRADLALTQFAQQAGVPILFPVDRVADLVTRRLTGTHTVTAGLAILLEGTGLVATIDDMGQLIVRRPPAAAMETARPEPRVAQPQIVEEIVVNARRRDENLQQVPIALTALSGADLALRGIDLGAGLNAAVPNLSVSGGRSAGDHQAAFAIRGMPGVAVYVDGVYLSSTEGLLTGGLVGLDRIEVLRGPQGTLFGNSSLGGAIHFITRPPAGRFGGRFETTVGSGDRRDFQGFVDLPWGSRLQSKLTAVTLSRDGFVTSRADGSQYGDLGDELYRADIRWTPVPAVTLRYSAEQALVDHAGAPRVVGEIQPVGVFDVGGIEYNTNPQAQAYLNAFGVRFDNANNVSGYPGGRLERYETAAATPGSGTVIDSLRHTLDAGWTTPTGLRLRSISGYRELERKALLDFDGTAEVSMLEWDSRVRQFEYSQELQLLGTLGGRQQVNWVLGGFYNHTNLRSRSVNKQLPEFVCDLPPTAALERRRVTLAQQVACFNNRAAALGVASLFSASTAMTRDQLIALNQSMIAARPNFSGVTPELFSSRVAGNTDNMTRTLTDSKAAFADVSWQATDRFTLAAGLRYSSDTSDGVQNITGNRLASPGPIFQGGDVDNFFDYTSLPTPAAPTRYSALTKRLSLQYQWTPRLMTYLAYADGYGPGGRWEAPLPWLQLDASGRAVGGYLMNVYNAGLSDVPPFTERDEQTVRSYELGLKADWLDGRLRTNLTAFFTDWRNVPVSGYAPTQWWDTDSDGYADTRLEEYLLYPGTRTVGVNRADVRGLEFEALWYPGEAWRFGLAIGTLDARYVDLGEAGAGPLPIVTLDSRFASAPESTVSVSAAYDFALGNGRMLAPRLDYTRTAAFTLFTGDVDQRVQEAYGLLNARLTYTSAAPWSVSLFGTNLLDEYYALSGHWSQSNGFHFKTLGRPREYGLTVEVRFE